MESERIAFIGLGAMGLPMATNLQNYLKSQDKEPLIVYNRTFSKTEPLVKIGAIAAQTLKQVSEQANIIFTCLANDEAVNQIYGELFELLKFNDDKNVIFIEMGTIYPKTIADIKENFEKVPHTHVLYCPIFGPPNAAKNSKLVIITSGHQHSVDYIMPLLIPVLGYKTITFGEDVIKAGAFKLIGNFFIGGIIELLSEGTTLAQKTSIGLDKLMEFIDLFLPIRLFQDYGKKIQTDSFLTDVGFTVSGFLKDVSHMRRLAAESECPLPIADMVHQHLITAKANGGENYDWISMVGALRIAAGLSFIKNE